MSLLEKFQAAVSQLREKNKEAAAKLLREAQETLKEWNAQSEAKLREQIGHVAAQAGKGQPLRAYPRALDENSVPLQNHSLTANAALTLYPNDRTTFVIKQFQTASQHKLIEETKTPDGRKKLAIWNEKTKLRDAYEEIHTEIGKQGSAQFTAYYDVANRRITIHYAGTVFTDFEDLKSATQTLSEAPSMRMTRVKDCIDKMVASFNEHYPGQLAKTPIDIYAHSAGANAVALTNYFLQRSYGLVPRAQVMIDPFGAKESFEQVSEMIARAEGRNSKKVFDELSRNTFTFKPMHLTFIDAFKVLKALSPALGNTPATVGTVKFADVGGNTFSAHQIRTWVKYFNNEEFREAQNPPPRLFKRAGPKP